MFDLDDPTSFTNTNINLRGVGPILCLPLYQTGNMPDPSIPSTLNQLSVDYNMINMVNDQPHPLERRRDPEPPITSLRKSVHAA
ncbi:unnamed protein product [Musa acuminata subsp. burmannicoides]